MTAQSPAKPTGSKTIPPLHRSKYGATWHPLLDVKGNPVAERPDWMIEKDCINAINLDRAPPGARRWEDHFINLANLFWGDPTGIAYFEANPNFCEILTRYRQYNKLSVAGCASSGKTEALAVIGLLEWFIDPFGCKVLLSSQTKQSSKGKIFGSVSEYWQQLCKIFGGEQNLPGKLVSSQTILRYNYNGVVSDKVGLELIAGEASAAVESAGKIQGVKRGKLLLLLDELATLAPNILNTAFSNLNANADCRILGCFNPESHFDPGGILSCPVDGWDSVNIDSTGWPTQVGGWCVRLDGEKSPNVLAGKEIWRGLMTTEKLAAFKEAFHGNENASYYRMVRGWWSPTGSLDCIFSESDIIQFGAQHNINTWMDRPVMGASLDPAFSHGGDNAVACIGKVGMAKNPNTGEVQKTLEKIKTVIITDDVKVKNQSRSEQVVAGFKKLLLEYNIETSNVVVDDTGGGAPFSALLARDIGTGFLQVGFKSRPSELPVSKNDRRKGVDRFANKVSEIWYVLRELVRTGQVKGLDPDTINELTARTYKEIGGKVQVEPKEKMKARTNGKSPDRGDALALLCEWARQKHGLSSTEKAAAKKVKTKFTDPFLVNLYPPKKAKSLFADEPVPIGLSDGGWGY